MDSFELNSRIRFNRYTYSEKNRCLFLPYPTGSNNHLVYHNVTINIVNYFYKVNNNVNYFFF